ncbi:transmembrane protein 184C [Ischnura elegans]|uniref:transmembrane protein 184C n=1 Tax=Ischnura elegans TaxID=197161 RepID=UPI001ED8A16B|nr:transmembrane protein 184C [Ischnura elegans]
MCCLSIGALLSRWRLWIRPVVMAIYALVIIVVLPMIIANAFKRGFRKEDEGAIIGGVFVMMSLPISFWGIIQHLVHYTKPYLQKHIIRILWMVPIYALNAWLGLAFPVVSIYLDSLRECYEAYVIYNFMVYLLNYLNSRMNLEASLAMKPQVYHIFPLCCLQPWEMGSEFVHMCKHGILQYTVVRPFTTIVSFICEMNHVYGEGEFRGDVAFPYMIAVNNLSQFVAMYCLVLFYKANREELAPMNPIGKFLCIKAVVFFSFFQGVIIAILVYTGVISSVFGTNDSGSIKDISSKLQDFLICIEMFLAAVAHHFSFTYKPYIDLWGSNQTCCDAFLMMWDVSDVQRDIGEHFGVVGSSLSRRFRGRASRYQPIGETTRLLVPTPEDESTPLVPSAPQVSVLVGHGDEVEDKEDEHGIPIGHDPAAPTPLPKKK